MPAYDQRYAVNLSFLFTELPLLERPAAAAAAGFDAVELRWPFAGPVPTDGELCALRRALDEAETRLVSLILDPGDLAAGERGLLSQPRYASRFRAGVEAAVDLAGATGCRVLGALYGNRVRGVDPRVQDELAFENLRFAAEAAARVDAVVAVEALNAYENPDYPLTSSGGALALTERLRAEGVRNVTLLADLYHLARMGEDLGSLIAAHAHRFGHVQLADAPGRHQPGTGTTDLHTALGLLEAVGYHGFVGLEYAPLGPSGASFGWLPRMWRPSGARVFGACKTPRMAMAASPGI